jgi:hypothetical protein
VIIYYTKRRVINRDKAVSIHRIEPLHYDARRMNKAMRRFIDAVQPQITALNQLIEAYRAPSGPREERRLLEEIKQAYEAMDGGYPDDILSQCPDYIDKIHGTLFQEIQDEFQEISLREKTSVFPFSEILEQMDPQRVNRMAKILSLGASANLGALRSLYTWNEPGGEAFHRFLDEHEITYLGGNNSKNFKVWCKPRGPTFVLKLENRMGMPRNLAVDLRKKLPTLFTQIHARRQVSYEVRGERLTRGLLVTDYCDGRDLESDSLACDDTQKRLHKTVNIYSQMARALERIQGKGGFFYDMKNSNWLLNSEWLVLDDDKSFHYVDERGMVSRHNVDNMWFEALSTSYMRPPEYDTGQDFDAEAAHVHMLGKNLYQHVTQCSYTAFYRHEVLESDASTFAFPRDIFETEEGALFEELIRGMVKTEPSDRMPLKMVENKLGYISCRQILKDIHAFKRNEADDDERMSRVLGDIKLKMADPDNNMEHMHRMEAQLEAIRSRLGLRVIRERHVCNGRVEDIMRSHGHTHDDRNMQRFEEIMLSKVDQAYDAKDLNQLSRLQKQLNTTRDAFQVLGDIVGYRVHGKDREMDRFVFDMQRRIVSSASPEESRAIHDELLSTFRAVKQTEVHFDKARKGYSTQVFQDLLNRTNVRHAMGDVPLKERTDFVKDTFQRALKSRAMGDDKAWKNQDFKARYEAGRDRRPASKDGVEKRNDDKRYRNPR